MHSGEGVAVPACPPSLMAPCTCSATAPCSLSWKSLDPMSGYYCHLPFSLLLYRTPLEGPLTLLGQKVANEQSATHIPTYHK